MQVPGTCKCHQQNVADSDLHGSCRGAAGFVQHLVAGFHGAAVKGTRWSVPLPFRAEPHSRPIHPYIRPASNLLTFLSCSTLEGGN